MTIVQAQLDAGVPLRSIIRPRNPSETRWGGLKELADVNGVFRPAVVPAVEQYKIDHRNEKDAITETVEDGTTKEMKAVPAKDIGPELGGVSTNCRVGRPFRTGVCTEGVF